MLAACLRRGWACSSAAVGATRPGAIAERVAAAISATSAQSSWTISSRRDVVRGRRPGARPAAAAADVAHVVGEEVLERPGRSVMPRAASAWHARSRTSGASSASRPRGSRRHSGSRAGGSSTPLAGSRDVVLTSVQARERGSADREHGVRRHCAGDVTARERMRDGDDRGAGAQAAEASGCRQAHVGIAVVQRQEEGRLRLVAAHVTEERRRSRRGGGRADGSGRGSRGRSPRWTRSARRLPFASRRRATARAPPASSPGRRRRRSPAGAGLVAVEEREHDGFGAPRRRLLPSQPVRVDAARAQKQRKHEADRNQGKRCEEDGPCSALHRRPSRAGGIIVSHIAGPRTGEGGPRWPGARARRSGAGSPGRPCRPHALGPAPVQRLILPQISGGGIDVIGRLVDVELDLDPVADLARCRRDDARAVGREVDRPRTEAAAAALGAAPGEDFRRDAPRQPARSAARRSSAKTQRTMRCSMCGRGRGSRPRTPSAVRLLDPDNHGVGEDQARRPLEADLEAELLAERRRLLGHELGAARGEAHGAGFERRPPLFGCTSTRNWAVTRRNFLRSSCTPAPWSVGLRLARALFGG